MKQSWSVPGLAAAGLLAACSTPPPAPRLPSALPAAPRAVTVRVIEGGAPRIRMVPLEDYVRASVVSEFAPPAGDPAVAERMLEVQAIISRTYALANLGRHRREGFDLCSSTHCQVFEASRLATSRWARVAGDLTARTAGEVLWYDGAPAQVLFHADCGGHTSPPEEVWGGSRRPYLIGMSDEGPALEAHAAWRYEIALAELVRALDGDSRTRVDGRLDTLSVLDRDSAGRVQRLALSGQRERIVRGEDLRDVMSHAFGPRTIRSTMFTVRRQRSIVAFEGRGFGHGVGLCQAGALARIRSGVPLADVLQTYFPGVRVVTLPHETDSRQ